MLKFLLGRNKYIDDSQERKYTRYEKRCSNLLKNLEKKTFEKRITTNKYVSTYDYSNQELIEIIKTYYKNCINTYQNKIYYLTVDFLGESVSIYTIYDNNTIKQQIILNDRISDSCKIINSKEYYLDKQCSICFDIPDTTLKCGHDFHNTCLIKYIKSLRENQNQDAPSVAAQTQNQLRRLRRISNIVTIQCPICRTFIF